MCVITISKTRSLECNFHCHFACIYKPKMFLWGGTDRASWNWKVLFGRSVLAQNGALTGSLMVKTTTSIYLLVWASGWNYWLAVFTDTLSLQGHVSLWSFLLLIGEYICCYSRLAIFIFWIKVDNPFKLIHIFFSTTYLN